MSRIKRRLCWGHGWRNMIGTKILPLSTASGRHDTGASRALTLILYVFELEAQFKCGQMLTDAANVSDFHPAAALQRTPLRELKNLCIEMCLAEDNRRGDEKCANERRWFTSSRQTNCCDNSGGQIELETDNRPDKAFSSGWNGERKLHSFCTTCSSLLSVISSQSVSSLV